jgi:hypothetical protein
MNRIDIDQRAVAVGELRCPLDIADRAEGVRGRANRDELRPLPNLALQILPVELARSRPASEPCDTVTPRSFAISSHGSTLAWWSSSVTTILSPGDSNPRPSAREMWKVMVDMLSPKRTRSADN